MKTCNAVSVKLDGVRRAGGGLETRDLIFAVDVSGAIVVVSAANDVKRCYGECQTTIISEDTVVRQLLDWMMRDRMAVGSKLDTQYSWFAYFSDNNGRRWGQICSSPAGWMPARSTQQNRTGGGGGGGGKKTLAPRGRNKGRLAVRKRLFAARGLWSAAVSNFQRPPITHHQDQYRHHRHPIRLNPICISIDACSSRKTLTPQSIAT